MIDALICGGILFALSALGATVYVAICWLGGERNG